MPATQYEAGLNFLDYVRHTALHPHSFNIWESVFDSDNFPGHDTSLPFYGFRRLHQGHNIIGAIHSDSLRIEPEPFGFMSGVVTDIEQLSRDSYRASLDRIIEVTPLIFFIDKRIRLAGEHIAEHPINMKVREIPRYTTAQGRVVYTHLEEYRNVDKKLLSNPDTPLEELASALLDMFASTENRIYELYLQRLARKAYFKNEKAREEVVKFREIWDRYKEIKATQRFREENRQLMPPLSPIMAEAHPTYI